MKLTTQRGIDDFQHGTHANIFISDMEILKNIELNLTERIVEKVSEEFLSQRMPSILGGLVLQQEQIPKLVMEKIVAQLVEKMMNMEKSK